MDIYVKVAKAVAIRNKLNNYGEQYLPLVDWEGWTDEERNMLARLDEPIAVEAFTIDALRVAVHEGIAAEQEKQQRAADDKRRRAELLAALPDLARKRIAAEGYDWVTHRGEHTPVNPAAAVIGNYYPREMDATLHAYVVADDEMPQVRSTHGSPPTGDTCAWCTVPDDLAAEIKAALNRLNTTRCAEIEREYLANQAKQDAEVEAKHAAKKAIETKRQAKEKEADDLFFAIATEEQRKRHAAGYLPKQERDGVARTHVFLPFGDFDDYERLVREDIDHTDDCDHGGGVDWGEDVVSELTASQFDVLTRIKSAASHVTNEHPTWSVAVEPREKTGSCPCTSCRRKVRRVGILVTITTAQGNEYSWRFAA